MYITLDPNMPHYLHYMCSDSRGFTEQEQVYSSCRETVNITERAKILSKGSKQLPTKGMENFPLSKIQVVC